MCDALIRARRWAAEFYFKPTGISGTMRDWIDRGEYENEIDEDVRQLAAKVLPLIALSTPASVASGVEPSAPREAGESKVGRVCRHCRRPYPVSDRVAEENPFCAACLHERVALARIREAAKTVRVWTNSVMGREFEDAVQELCAAADVLAPTAPREAGEAKGSTVANYASFFDGSREWWTAADEAELRAVATDYERALNVARGTMLAARLRSGAPPLPPSSPEPEGGRPV